MRSDPSSDLASDLGPNALVPVISAAVMTHPARLEAARHVAARLAPLEARLAVDPEPDGPRGAMRSARLAFAAGAAGATHHLVVQDDAWLPKGFAEAAQQVVARQPHAAVSFFVEWGSRTATLARWAALTGASWVPVVNPYVPTVALVMPSHLAAELGRFLRTEASTEESDDEAVLRFMSRTGTRALIVVPNVVEHLDLPSLTGNEDHGARRSVCIQPVGMPTTLNATVLDVPSLVPFLAWTSGISIMVDTTRDPKAPQRPTIDVLAEWDCDRATLSAAYESSLNRVSASASLRTGVGDGYLFELWITAVAMGAIQHNRWPTSSAVLESALDDPVAAQALRTMVPGGLRRFLDMGLLDAHADRLTALMLDGMKHGAMHGNARLTGTSASA